MLLPADTQGRASVVGALTVPLVALGALLAIGVSGLVLLEGWPVLDAVWMVVITVSTIGYGEVRPLSDVGRLFLLVFIMAGVGIGTHGLTVSARYVADGGLALALRRRRGWREVERMKDHMIVVGYGRLGREVVAELRHHGQTVVVVDLVAPDPPPDGLHVIVGDATHDEVLLAAGASRARGLAVATPSDAVNVYVTLSARQLAPALHIVTRVEDEAAAEKARRAGANDCLMAYQLGGSRMSQGLLRPGASAFVEHATSRGFADLALDDVRIAQPAFTGTLSALRLRARFGVMVVAVRRAGSAELELPHGDTCVALGDVLVVLGPPADVERFVTEAT